MNRSSTKTFLKGGLLTAIGALVLVGTVGNGADHANAEELNFSATIRPSLLVEIPTDTIRLEVQPELGKDTFAKMAMNVVVSTNNPTGYQMNATADSTDLTKIEADNNGVFAKIKTLDSLAGGYTEETFTPNRWGYKIDDGNYLPFSLSTNLINTTSPANGEETTITFGAKVNMDQPYGIYELTLNFQTVANVTPIYIQDYTLADCAGAENLPELVTDARDGKTYRVRKINGVCTMIDNLDFTLTTGMTLDPATTNVAATKKLGTVGSLESGESFDEMRIARQSTWGYGTYYNYAAATLGTITGEENEDEVVEDVCPAGWRLPTHDEQTAIVGLDEEDYGFHATNVVPFNAVTSGYYYEGSFVGAGFVGLWWSSTVYDATFRYALVYGPEYGGLLSSNGDSRDVSSSVRCVRK